MKSKVGRKSLFMIVVDVSIEAEGHRLPLAIHDWEVLHVYEVWVRRAACNGSGDVVAERIVHQPFVSPHQVPLGGGSIGSAFV